MGTICVVGVGRMGVAISYALHKLGHTLYFVEPGPGCRKDAVEKLKDVGVSPKDVMGQFAGQVGPKFFKSRENISLVISAAPYHLNTEIAKVCIDNGVDYCDLGGNPDVSDEIHWYADDNVKACAFTDLGLAPGHMNILAEKIAAECAPHDLNMFCGGLPQVPTNMLGYNTVFSIDGLINEYMGKCQILEDGKMVEVDALSGCQQGWLHLGDLDLEMFHTKGGMSTTLKAMQGYGVKNCCYKTIRYSGHVHLIKLLIDDCKLSPDVLHTALTNACPPTDKDLIHMAIRYVLGGGDVKILRSTTNADEHWTAMQKMTAFPAAVVASMMSEGLLGENAVMTYDDVRPKYDKYIELLHKIDDQVQWEVKREE